MTIVDATYKKEYTIKFTFSDGSVKEIDFKNELLHTAIYKPFLDIKKFKKFKIDPFAIRWPGNVLDFHYEKLLKMSV